MLKAMSDHETKSTDTRVVMYTTPWCGYCNAAKRLLGQLGIAYVDHDVSRDVALRQRIADETGWRTVPMIYLDGRFVGGFDDLSALHRRGGLVR
ncbi:MAG: glutaredoxin [Myxococcales bacterium]|nr:glutaredoxin [Myxococcales bacterium]